MTHVRVTSSLPQGWIPAPVPSAPERVLVALSGGVDSSLAAALLVEQGHDVVGVWMRLHSAADSVDAGRKSCCTLDAADDARDRKSTRLNSSHTDISRMPSSA